MKRQFWKGCLLAGFLCLSLDVVSQTQVLAVDQVVQIAQRNSAYNQYMRCGYTETRRRNYRKALRCFQQAQQIRPNDQYARAAIRNVNSYLQRGRVMMAFVPGKPDRTRSAGTRGNIAIALTPTNLEAQRTTAEHPTLFFYIPDKKVQRLEFVLRDGDGLRAEPLYTKTLKRVGQAGIVSLTIPVDQPSLKIGKQYSWSLSVIYNPDNPFENQVLQGKIERVLDENLDNEIHQTSERLEQARLYVISEFWEDALSILADLRRQYPNDSQVQESWRELLTSVQLGKLADKPLLSCCTSEN